MRIFILLLVTFSFLISKEISGFSSPESVISDKSFIYVSNVGKELKPMEKDGDGFISKLSNDGKILNLKFISNLNAPKGMTIIKNTLFVVDIDRVLGFNLKSTKEVFNLEIKGAKFLNDITKRDRSTLFISETVSGSIFKIDLKAKKYTKLEVEEIKGANGIFYTRNKLFVVGFGKENKPNGEIGFISLNKKPLKFEKLSNYNGYLDGLIVDGDKIYFSDWVAFEKKGVINVLQDSKLTTLTLKPIAGPADFYIDGDKILIPKMMENKVLIKPLP